MSGSKDEKEDVLMYPCWIVQKNCFQNVKKLSCLGLTNKPPKGKWVLPVCLSVYLSACHPQKKRVAGLLLRYLPNWPLNFYHFCKHTTIYICSLAVFFLAVVVFKTEISIEFHFHWLFLLRLLLIPSGILFVIWKLISTLIGQWAGGRGARGRGYWFV